MDIDFVVTWVDGNDPALIQRRNAYASDVNKAESTSTSKARYREWDTFRYWFRSVEENAPWVRKVFLITDHQIPDFLKVDHPKLRIVFHDEYIPAEYLPTFNSVPIELNLHRIQELSEQFVYFNDDTFLNKPQKPTDFFRKGKPCYDFIERPFVPMAPLSLINYICLNDMGVVNKHFKRKGMLRHINKVLHPSYGKAGLRNLFMLPWKNFQHFQDNHMPCPFLKSTFAEVWETENEICNSTSLHKFRTAFDINQYVFKYWDLARWNFAPYHFEGGYYCVDPNNLSSLTADIVKAVHPMICVNDNEALDNAQYEVCRAEVEKALAVRYPEKSSFEK